MKIINREEFLKQSEGILYSEYKPFSFYGLYVKGNTISSEEHGNFDYNELGLIGNINADNSDELYYKLDVAEKISRKLNLDFECGMRNGGFDGEQLYAVYEQKDIEGLINVLKSCKGFES